VELLDILDDRKYIYILEAPLSYRTVHLFPDKGFDQARCIHQYLIKTVL